VPRSPAPHIVGAVALWLCTAVLAAFATTGHVQQSGPGTALGAGLTALVGALSLLVAAGTISLGDARRAAGAATIVAPIALALVVVGGGARSPAAPAVAFCVLAWAWDRGVRAAAAGALAAALALLAAHVAVQGGPPGLADLVAPAVVLVAVGVVPVWLLGPAHARVTALPARASAIERLLDDSGGARGRRVSGPVRAVPGAATANDQAGGPAESLEGYLAEVREGLAADHVVLWRWDDATDALAPVAWASAAAHAPLRRDADEWLPLVTWSAQEGIVHCAGAGDSPRLAAAPVTAGRYTLGALSAYSVEGLGMTRELLKRRLALHGANAGLLVDLLDTRQKFARQNSRSEALLRVAQQFQADQSVEALGRALCDAALRVTSADRVAVVRWDRETGLGNVQSASPGHAIDAGFTVTSDSQIGMVCVNARPQVWDNARLLEPGTPVYGPGERRRQIGSLGIVPLQCDRRVIGAIVLEADAAAEVVIEDTRIVGVVAALAAGSLETVWELEEVDRRARTDQLTGLSNRRHFDEHLARMLAESDRLGGPVGLIVADIDFFKRVNDTFGHEAGDAVLRSVATTIQREVRAIDICARFGGEEIAVLLPGTGLAGACEVAARLRGAVQARTLRCDGREVAVTASFGVASFPECAHAGESFFPAADRALYKAKSDGRNCVRAAPVIDATRRA
jgi:diguanylate cyclase (GGDEF)-like protein